MPSHLIRLHAKDLRDEITQGSLCGMKYLKRA